MHKGSIKDGKLILVERNIPENPEEGRPYAEHELVDGAKREVALALLGGFVVAASQDNFDDTCVCIRFNTESYGQRDTVLALGLGLDQIFKDVAGFKKVDTMAAGLTFDFMLNDANPLSEEEYRHNILTQAVTKGDLLKKHAHIRVAYDGQLPKECSDSKETLLTLSQTYINVAQVDRIEDKGTYRSIYLKPISQDKDGETYHSLAEKNTLEASLGLS